MPTKRELLIALVLIVVGALAWSYARHEAEIEHGRAAAAEAVVASQEKTIARANEDIQARDADAVEYSKQKAAEAAAVTTPQKAAAVVQQHTPAPAGDSIQIVATKDLPAALQQDLPNAPDVALVPAAQFEAIARQQLVCDATTHTLASCKADNLDYIAELTARKREVDALQVALKGGTKWQRFVHVVRCVAITGAGAYLGSRFDSHNSAQGAALGAGAGAVGCSLF